VRRTILILSAVTGFAALGACSTLGERSTLAELQERCESRGGTLIPSDAAATGYRCEGVTRMASVHRNSPTAASAQLSRAVDRSLSPR